MRCGFFERSELFQFASFTACACNFCRGLWQNAVQGRAFYTEDFDQNIVCLYHELAGTKRPRIQIPCVFCVTILHSDVRLILVAPKFRTEYLQCDTARRYWVLSVMVHVAIFLAILVHKIFCGYQVRLGTLTAFPAFCSTLCVQFLPPFNAPMHCCYDVRRL